MRSSEIKHYLLRKIDSLPEKVPAGLHQLIQDFLEKIAKTPPLAKKQREFGNLKGMVIYMADDFDAPLEDFKEYM